MASERRFVNPEDIYDFLDNLANEESEDISETDSDSSKGTFCHYFLIKTNIIYYISFSNI